MKTFQPFWESKYESSGKYSVMKASLKSFLPPLYNLSRKALCAGLLLFWLPVTAMAKEVNWGSLNLSPQQENKIEQLEAGWEKTHAEVSEQIDRDMDELKAILPNGDTQRIRTLQNRITTNKMYLMNQSMDTFLKKRDMLNPAQRGQLQKMLPGRN